MGRAQADVQETQDKLYEISQIATTSGVGKC